MKIISTISILILVSLNSIAQNKFPDFKFAKIEVNIPLTLPGIKEDPAATKGDYITYKLKGQKFQNGQGALPTVKNGYTGTSQAKNPYQALADALAAYAAKDWEKVKSFYLPESRDQMDRMLPPEKRPEFLNYMASITSLKIVLAYAYNDGVITVSESNDGNISVSYFIKKNGRYWLSVLRDDSPMMWNLSAYYRYRPEPITKPNSVTHADSIQIDKTLELRFVLQKQGNWVLLHKDKTGSPIIVKVQDNSEADMDKRPGRVSILLNKRQFSGVRKYQIFASEANYPVTQVSNLLLLEPMPIEFSVYR
jgi:hypothetical protein